MPCCFEPPAAVAWLKREREREREKKKIILYIYHALINALSVDIIHINLNTIFYMCIEDSPTKTIYIRDYMETHTQ